MLTRNLSHALRLAVSIFSLRKFYDGKVAVFFDGATEQFVKEHFGKCKVLRITPMQFNGDISQVEGKRNASYASKSVMPQMTPFRDTLFLDADTLVIKSVDDLFERLEFSPLVLTSFSDWTTTNKPVRCRLKKWISKTSSLLPSGSWRQLVQDTIDQGGKAINTGVYAFRGYPSSLELWRQITFAMADHFICDELAMQLVASSVDCDIVSDSYNFSPIYGQSDPKDVSIVHFHGGKHTRENALKFFGPAYNEAVTANVANLQHWAPAHDPAVAKMIEQANA